MFAIAPEMVNSAETANHGRFEPWSAREHVIKQYQTNIQSPYVTMVNTVHGS